MNRTDQELGWVTRPSTGCPVWLERRRVECSVVMKDEGREGVLAAGLRLGCGEMDKYAQGGRYLGRVTTVPKVPFPGLTYWQDIRIPTGSICATGRYIPHCRYRRRVYRHHSAPADDPPSATDNGRLQSGQATSSTTAAVMPSQTRRTPFPRDCHGSQHKRTSWTAISRASRVKTPPAGHWPFSARSTCHATETGLDTFVRST